MFWNKCKDKLPKESGEYLHCFVDDEDASVAYYQNDTEEFSWHAMIMKADETQCWMPLPKPLKSKNEF